MSNLKSQIWKESPTLFKTWRRQATITIPDHAIWKPCPTAAKEI